MKLATIVTCKGRLAHLAQTAPTILRASLPFDCGYVLVDWGCPDGSGAWLTQTFPSKLVQAVQVPAQGFHKTRAQNLGAQRAIKMGASYLLFADADTILQPPFFEWLIPNLSSDTFIFAAHKRGRTDTTGIIAVHTSAFVRAGGFDEGFDRYGNEDVDLRLRLWTTGTRFLTFPDWMFNQGIIRAIPHDDVLRTQYYPDQDRARSSKDTLDFLMARYRQRTGRDLQADWLGPAGGVIQFLIGGNE
jgi:hypothetical protein